MLRKIMSFILLSLSIPQMAFASDAFARIGLARNTDCSGFTAEARDCWDTDDDKYYIGSGSSAVLIGPGVAVAPSDATYITQTVNGTLSAEQALASLTTGILKSTTGTGIVSIATAGTDYYNPGGTDVALADGGTGASLSDPNAHRILGWDDTDNAVKMIVIGTNLSYDAATDTLSATGGASLPVADTISVVEGSADNTKEIRFEVDGLTTATVRVITPPDKNFTMIASGDTFTGDVTGTLDTDGSTALSIASNVVGPTQIDETANYAWSGNSTVTGTYTFDSDAIHIFDTNATHDLIITPGSDLTADRVLTITTGDAARTLTLTGDASITGTNTGDVTLAGTPDYITISGQAITRAKLDPADDLNTFASSVLLTLLTDETGSGVAVFGTSPVFTTDLTTPIVKSAAADPADAGAIRLGNAELIEWEASPAGTDVTLTVDSSEIMQSSGTFNAATLTEGGTGVPNTGDNLSVFAATTSLQLLGVISDETGSGALVFGTSPTFTTSAIFGATGVSVTDDADGQITLLGLSTGFDEDWSINLDDTSNVVVHSTTTGVTTHRYALTGNSKLDILTDSTAEYSILAATTNGDDWEIDAGGSTVSDIPNGLAIYNVTDATYRLIITDAGNVGIGETASSAITTKFWILGADNSTVQTIKINAAQASVTTADIFMDFRSTTGSEGTIAGTASAGIIAYNTFTGSHWTHIEDREGLEPLLLLEMTDAKPTFGKEQLFGARICNTPFSKKAVGVYGGTDVDGHDFVLSIGTGFVIVANTGRNIEQGDYLTSYKNGLAQLQMKLGMKDGVYQNYTVAKATESVTWEKGEKERRISCVYLGG